METSIKGLLIVGIIVVVTVTVWGVVPAYGFPVCALLVQQMVHQHLVL